MDDDKLKTYLAVHETGRASFEFSVSCRTSPCDIKGIAADQFLSLWAADEDRDFENPAGSGDEAEANGWRIEIPANHDGEFDIYARAKPRSEARG